MEGRRWAEDHMCGGRREQGGWGSKPPSWAGTQAFAGKIKRDIAMKDIKCLPVLALPRLLCHPAFHSILWLC